MFKDENDKYQKSILNPPLLKNVIKNHKRKKTLKINHSNKIKIQEVEKNNFGLDNEWFHDVKTTDLPLKIFQERECLNSYVNNKKMKFNFQILKNNYI